MKLSAISRKTSEENKNNNQQQMRCSVKCKIS